MIEYLDIGLTIIGTILAMPVVKAAIITAIPQTAPFFLLFNKEAKELNKVVTISSSNNEDLRRWAIEQGLKVAAKLIEPDKK